MRVYLSGPMEDCSGVQIHGWRQIATRLLGERGSSVLDPSIGETAALLADPVALVRKDTEMLDLCDVVLAYPWKPSTGTAMEIMYACLRGTPVVVVCQGNRINPWLVVHAQVVKDFPEAVECMGALVFRSRALRVSR